MLSDKGIQVSNHSESCLDRLDRLDVLVSGDAFLFEIEVV